MQRIFLVNPSLSRVQQRVALLTISIPMLGALAALYWIATREVSNVTLVVAFCMYLVTTSGLTIGFHRLFAHRSFKPTRSVKVALAIFGMMAAQGPLVFWVASHRRHHAFSDTESDCHSPCHHGPGVWGKLKGLWHAHFGWMLAGEITNVPMFAKDILKDGTLVWMSRFYIGWVMLGLFIPAVIGSVFPGGWLGAVEGLLWGGFFRIFFVHQITWALNSLNHVFGCRRYACDDESRNIAWLAIMTMGEGWHNNHHAYPSSAKFGHKWWEFDLGFMLISILGLMRLCEDIQFPNAKALERKERASQSNFHQENS